MGGSVKSRRNHTLMCLTAVYGIHGILFHVLSSPSVFVTSVIVKSEFLRNIKSKSQTSFNNSFDNQSSFNENKVRKNVSVYLSVTYHTYTMEKNVDVRNKSDASSSEIPLFTNVLLKKKVKSHDGPSTAMETCSSSKWIQDLLNSTTSSTAAGTLSVMAFFFSDVTIFKTLSPSAWGVLIACLVFVFTSTNCDREISSR